MKENSNVLGFIFPTFLCEIKLSIRMIEDLVLSPFCVRVCTFIVYIRLVAEKM